MYNLPAYYLLPLIGLNFKNFGSYKSKSNLKIIQLDIKSLRLICTVYNLESVKETIYETKNFIGMKGNSIHYTFPSSVPSTVDAFIKGKYSKIPASIKKFIKDNCGLPKEHDVMLALEQNSKLKEKLEESLSLQDSIVRLEDDAELLSVPKEEWFIT